MNVLEVPVTAQVAIEFCEKLGVGEGSNMALRTVYNQRHRARQTQAVANEDDVIGDAENLVWL